MTYDVPDSSRSWVIAMAASLIYFLQCGLQRVGALLFIETMSHFNVNREIASIPYFLSFMVRAFAGPISGFLDHVWGVRPVIILGCLLSAVGVGVCFFATHIFTLYIFWGVFYGIGCSLAISLLPQVINLYFKNHVSKANGISMSGMTISGLVLLPVVEYLLKSYDIDGTFLILSALTLNCIPAAILLKRPNLRASVKVQSNLCHVHVSESLEKSDLESSKQSIEASMLGSTLDESKDSTTENIDFHNMNLKSEFEAFPNRSNNLPKEVNLLKEGATEDLQEYNNTSYTEIDLRNNGNYNTVSKTRSLDSNIDFEIPKTNGVDPQDLHTFPSFALTLDGNSSGNANPFPRSDSIQTDSLNQDDKIFIISNKNIESILASHNGPSKFKRWCQPFKVFYNLSYILIALTQSSSTFQFIILPSIIVDYTKDKGASTSESVYAYMSDTLFELVGRIVFGWVTDGGYMSKKNFVATCFFVLAVSYAGAVLANGYTAMVIAFSLIGMGFGASQPVLPGLICQYVAKDERAMAMASAPFLLFPLYFSSSSLIGYFRDYLGSYDLLVYLVSLINVLNVFLLLCLPCVERCRVKKNETGLEMND